MPLNKTDRRELERLLRGKEKRRKELARLPIEEKIRIVVEMQKIAADIARATGRTPREPWKIKD